MYLQGSHLQHSGKQPLILFPGFFQNGYVYDLSEEISLARFLWQSNFDVWIIHPRGTAQSEGRRIKSSIDDFAIDDIPAVIDYVFLKTGTRPVFVGHSQGGIAAIISMMGVTMVNNDAVIFSDKKREERETKLAALVTLGSYLDFSFSKKSWLKDFVTAGVQIKIAGKKFTLLRANLLLKLVTKFTFIGSPVSFRLRLALLQSGALEMFLFPLALALNFFSMLGVWQFLYHIPNLHAAVRQQLFYKTMDGTFGLILQQYYLAIANGEMSSADGSISYSNNYQRLTIPVSVVAMEFDSLADPVGMEQTMFDKITSEHKYFTLWKGVGHEDHFTNTKYFSQVLDAIKKVC